jgi:hypothetical protein
MDDAFDRLYMEFSGKGLLLVNDEFKAAASRYFDSFISSVDAPAAHDHYFARNVHFISSLMKAGVEFIACDFPQANRLTVHILAALAEHEATMISPVRPRRWQRLKLEENSLVVYVVSLSV